MYKYSETRITVEQTAHFSLLNGRKEVIKDNCHHFTGKQDVINYGQELNIVTTPPLKSTAMVTHQTLIHKVPKRLCLMTREMVSCIRLFVTKFFTFPKVEESCQAHLLDPLLGPFKKAFRSYRGLPLSLAGCASICYKILLW